MFKLRSFEELAEELGSPAKATALLKEAGAPLVHGMFDQGALDAMSAEPSVSNTGKKTKNSWTIAATDGLGAIKSVIDELDLDIVRHVYRGTNYITVRNARNQRAQLKVYCIGHAHPRTGNATFNLTGFLREGSAQFYMLMSFEGPQAWILSRTQAHALHKAAVKAGGESGGAKVSHRDLDDLNGKMRVTFSVDSDYLFKAAKQIGL